MPVLTVRDVPEKVFRALLVRAAQRGHSADAEVRATLSEAALRDGRVGLGSLLADIGRRAHLTREESANFAQRNVAPTEPVDLG